MLDCLLLACDDMSVCFVKITQKSKQNLAQLWTKYGITEFVGSSMVVPLQKIYGSTPTDKRLALVVMQQILTFYHPAKQHTIVSQKNR